MGEKFLRSRAEGCGRDEGVEVCGECGLVGVESWGRLEKVREGAGRWDHVEKVGAYYAGVSWMEKLGGWGGSLELVEGSRSRSVA